LIHFYKRKVKEDIMENCCDSLFKTIIMLFNLIFALVGLVLMGFGIYVQLEAKDYLNFLGDNYTNTPVFIIILGGIIFVVAFFGCCGAMKENKCMMYTYGFLLFVILIAQIGAGIAAFLLKGDLNSAIESNMKEGMKNYGAAGHEGVVVTWDTVQKGFECCGVKSWEEWKNVSTAGLPAGQVPESCCLKEEKGCGEKPTAGDVYSDGCYTIFSEAFTDNLNYVGVTALCVAAAEVIIISLACCLGKKMGLSSQYV
jgi:hypothetical protein